jgi:puromycin-sensitive aminopeptidase
VYTRNLGRAGGSVGMVTDNPHRLPRTATPSHYALVLEPDLAAASFTGTARISLEVHEASAELVCNAADLEITGALVRLADGRELAVEAVLDDELQRLHLRPEHELAPGRLDLHLTFTGTLNDKLRGWYRSTFTDAGGATRVIATTQMQATDCRRAFPCWDEPDFKAVFGITLVVEPGLLAISNGAEAQREEDPSGKVRVTFADTMPMSTYLVAMVVGPLEVTEAVEVDGVPLRIVHVPGKGHLTSTAVAVGAHGLRWFQRYYGIPYPTGKCDLVALPDFAAGAMENLGCITFRENLLLVDPATSTQSELQVVADVICHELAHMWFGDLVTMRWWNGIWLNEAFATFMEVAASDAYEPAWHRWDRFSLERTAAFEVDALATTRSVEFPVVSPADADGMFDVLTYEKGGALLRMLEQYLGEERFRSGIRHYLRTHSYGNTETSDLWDALEETTGEPVRHIMDTWIWQPGFPLLTVHHEAGDLHLTQRRFSFDGAAVEGTWAVPVQVRQWTDGTEDSRWMLLDGDRTTLPLLAGDARVVVNAGAFGFYRVAYTAELLGRLTGPSLTHLATPERYALVDDAWSSVVAASLGADDFCRFAAGFGAEDRLEVWQVLLAGLRWCGRFLEGEPREHFRAFVRGLVGPALARVGWEPAAGEAAVTGELRGALVGALAVLGNDPEAQERARALFERAYADPASVPAELAAAAVGVVAAVGTDADQARYLDRFRNAGTPQEQLRYLYALADFSTPAQMARTLDFAMSGEVKTQNAPFLLARCIGNRDTGAQAWRFVREHWERANATFPNSTIVRMVDTVKTLTRPEEVADVQAFFAEHPIPQATKTLEQVLERQRVNAALRTRAATELARAFDGGGQPGQG